MTEEELARWKEAEERLEREGPGPQPPRKLSDCQTLADLCRYVCKTVKLDAEYQMLFEGPHVIKWVWFGHSFTDKHVRIVEEALPSINDVEQLQELRLVATKVSANGAEMLRRWLPDAKVAIYTDEDHNNNWELSQASYPPKRYG